MINITDKSGTYVQIGDYIIYGHALGRCAGLRYGKVLGFKEHKEKDNYYISGDRTHKFLVIGVEDDWKREEPKLLTKESYLSFGDRILALTANQVPEKVRNLLDNYKPKQ